MIEFIINFFTEGQEFITANWFLLVASGFGALFLEKIVHILWHKYMHRIRHNWVHHLEWTTFQLKFPKENLKSPKAMEQVIASLHGKYSFGPTWIEEYLDGEVEYWFSLEIVGRSTGVSFYVHSLVKNKELLRNAFFAQYPDAEMVEVEDYMNEFPEKLPNETYEIFGTDYTLDKKDKHGHPLDCFPIKTYEHFDSPDKEQRLDPMATIVEAVANLKEDETFLIQLLIRPTGIAENHEFREGAEKVKAEITGKELEKEHGKSILTEIFKLFKSLIMAFVTEPKFEEEAEEEKPQFGKWPTQVENEMLKAIDNKLSKNLFESILRFVYIDRRDAFTRENPFAFFGAVTQFSDRNMNSLRPQGDTFTFAPKLRFLKSHRTLFRKKQRVAKRAKLLYKAYRERAMPISHHATFRERNIDEFILRTSVLSAEEIATIYHPPGKPIVAVQKMEPITTKRAGPPLTLPVLEE